MQKKKISEEGFNKQVIEVSKALQDWSMHYFVDGVLAIRGLGKSRVCRVLS